MRVTHINYSALIVVKNARRNQSDQQHSPFANYGEFLLLSSRTSGQKAIKLAVAMPIARISRSKSTLSAITVQRKSLLHQMLPFNFNSLTLIMTELQREHPREYMQAVCSRHAVHSLRWQEQQKLRRWTVFSVIRWTHCFFSHVNKDFSDFFKKYST